MKLHRTIMAIAASVSIAGAVHSAETVELYSYALPEGKSGLRVAWRADSLSAWESIGNNYNLVNSDFGPWGSHKKMFAPKLIHNRFDGLWVCTWSADPDGEVTAIATSGDLCTWSPQRYLVSPLDLPHDLYPAAPLRDAAVTIDGVATSGTIQRVDRSVVDSLKKWIDGRERLAARYDERAADDASRFAGLAPFAISVKADQSQSKPISDKLIGIFFEDINYGADGGLYAELIQNRDFEYSSSDRSSWDAKKAWSATGNGSFEIATDNPVHPNNPHYATLHAGGTAMSLINSGFDGIAVKKGESYRFSIMARAPRASRLTIELTDTAGNRIGHTSVKVTSNEWTTYKATIKASRTSADARLAVTLPASASVDVDMVSLFPSKTFRGRDNGLRNDLAQTLADLKPRFVRFPGGCVAHGDGVDNIYDWKGSIGPLESRKPLRNLWGYHQTRGLGYHEYFLFCEDIGAEPVPVVAAGVPCQNSGRSSHHTTCKLNGLGQQCGIPMEEMAFYIADVLDLIEYANGDVTTTWGARRAEAGHPEPFNLKYIGIGNEDMITEVFEPRFRMIYDAVHQRYPHITVIGTAGPFYEGTDYERGWKLARELDIPMLDEHYYVSPGWMIHNQDYSHSSDRNGSNEYLGEYAAHLPGRPNTVETALAEALYLTSVERNADIVAMTSYAPLLAKDGHTQWKPDMIYFNNTEVRPTTDYHVQRMFGNNSGTVYIPATVSAGDDVPADAMLRTGVSIVSDETTGDLIIKLVNMLPVEVTAAIDTVSLGIPAGTYRCEIFAGDPADTNALPVSDTVTLPSVKLRPYSFTVVRIPKQK